MNEIFDKLKYRRVNIALRLGGTLTGHVFAYKSNILVIATVARGGPGANQIEMGDAGIAYEFEFIPWDEIVGFNVESKLRVRNVGDEAFEKTELVEREESTLYPFRHDGWLEYEKAVRDKLDNRLKDLGVL